MRVWWKVTQYYLAVAVRQRAGWLVIACGALLVLGGAVVRDFHFGSAEARFLTDYSASVVALAGTLLLALLVPALFHDSLRNGTAVSLLMHGARRETLLLAQLSAAVVVLGWLLLVCVLGYGATMMALGHAAEMESGMRLLARGALPLLVIAAAGGCASTLTRAPFLATLLTLGFSVAGHLSAAAGSALAHAQGAAHVAWFVLGCCVPDFALFDTLPYLAALGYAGAFVLLYAGAGVWLFSRREF